MLKSCVHRGVAQLPYSHTATRPLARPIPEAGSLAQQRQSHSSNQSLSKRRKGFCCCSAAPAAMATTSISGKLAKLKEQGRCEQLRLTVLYLFRCHIVHSKSPGCNCCCRGAFIPFIVAGDPNMDATEQALLALDRAGADIIELGVPYSVRAHRWCF